MKNLLRLFPLTTNAFVLLATSLYALSLIKDSDLIATIYAYGIIGLLSILAILTAVNFLTIRNKISFQINSQKTPSTNYLHALQLMIKGAQVFPFCQLKIQIIFQHSDFSPPELIIRTKNPELRCDYNILFPHHGEWQISSVRYTISDILGLTAISKVQFQEVQTSLVAIEPPKFFSPQLPLVFSSLTAGDQINIPQHKLGDYYDLKKYHPSDGISKIIWKIYAKNQELIARHPEDTALPAGKSLVYIFADRKTPALLRHCYNYLQQIQSQDLEFAFSCSGAKSPVADDLEAVKGLTLHALWEGSAVDWPANLKNLNQLLATQKDCREIAIFLEESSPVTQQLENFFKNKRIKLCLLQTKDALEITNNWKQKFFYRNNFIVRPLNSKIKTRYV